MEAKRCCVEAVASASHLFHTNAHILHGSQKMLGGSYSYRATEVTWKLLKLMFAEYIIIHMLDIYRNGSCCIP
jgi:hypothetical protein